MSKMRIGVFSGGNIPSIYAHSFTTMKMAQGFADLGHEIEVVSANNRKVAHWRNKIVDLVSHYGLHKEIPIKWISPSPLGYITSRTANERFFCFRAAKFAWARKYDVVYCRSYLIPYYTSKFGIPTIVETHTTKYDIKPLQRLYEVSQLDNFKALITIHEKIKREHIKRGIPESKIIVLEDGVDLERFEINDSKEYWRKKLGLDITKKYAVYCGHLYPDKGIEMILGAAAKLLRRVNSLVFLLVGGSERDRHIWEKYCSGKKLGNVRFAGFVGNNEIPAYLKCADCLLLPYKTDMKLRVMDLETTSPLKLFEYMAAKRLIVATGVATVKKILRNGYNAIVTGVGIDSFTDGIYKALTMEEHMRCTLEENAWEEVKKFSWKQRCKTILDFAKLSID